MLVSISVLLHNKADVTRRFLQSLESILNSRPDVEVILRNNGSTDFTEDVVFACGLRNLIYVMSANLGFPQGHNENLKLAKGKYFLVLNNDVYLKDNKAIEKIIEPLKDEKIALVGLNGTCNSLRADGTGFYGNQCEYIEGSCLCGRTRDFKQYGLFSSAMEMFFFEDSDLSLRFRQLGFQLATVNIPHEHPRSQSLNLIDPNYKLRVFNHNKEIFQKRWSTYLVSKAFTNRILVKIESLGMGDVIAMTPVLEGLRRDHPNAILEVTSSCPDIFLGNPHLSELYESNRTYNRAYDRNIDIKPVYSSYELLAQQAAKLVGTQLTSYQPQIFMSKDELQEGERIVDSVKDNEDTVVVGVSLLMGRTEWEGRNWNLSEATRLVSLLQETGAKVIEFGKGIPSTGLADLNCIDQLTLREYMSVVNGVDLMICIDSLALHVAQAFQKPTFCLFGATDPIARIVSWATVYPIMRDLPCIGCYQKKGPRIPDQNKCEIGHSQICMEELSAETVFEHVVMDKAQLLARNTWLLQEHTRKSRV